MNRIKRIISSVVLTAFLLNTALSDYALAQNVNYRPNADKLSTPKLTDDINGFTPQRMFVARQTLETLLSKIAGENRSIYHMSRAEVANALTKAFEDLPREVREKTRFFFHEIPDVATMPGPTNGFYRLCVRCDVNDHGRETVYLTFGLDRDEADGFPVQAFPRAEAESRYNELRRIQKEDTRNNVADKKLKPGEKPSGNPAFLLDAIASSDLDLAKMPSITLEDILPGYYEFCKTKGVEPVKRIDTLRDDLSRKEKSLVRQGYLEKPVMEKGRYVYKVMEKLRAKAALVAAEREPANSAIVNGGPNAIAAKLYNLARDVAARKLRLSLNVHTGEGSAAYVREQANVAAIETEFTRLLVKVRDKDTFKDTLDRTRDLFTIVANSAARDKGYFAPFLMQIDLWEESITSRQAAEAVAVLSGVFDQFRAMSGLPVVLKNKWPETSGSTLNEIWSSIFHSLTFEEPIFRRVERERTATAERSTGRPAFANANKDTDIKPLPVYKITKYKGAIRPGEAMRDVLSDSSPHAAVTPEAYFMYRGIFRSREDVQKAFYDNIIRYDITIMPPARWGIEAAKTYGHFHDPIEKPEIYQVISGEAWYLMQKTDSEGNAIDVIMVRARPGEFVIMLPGYGHVTINPSEDRPLIMANWLTWHQDSFYGTKAQTSEVNKRRSYKENRGAAYYAKIGRNGKLCMMPNLKYGEPVHYTQMSPADKIPEFGLIKGEPIYNLVEREDFASCVRFLNYPADYSGLLKPENTLTETPSDDIVPVEMPTDQAVLKTATDKKAAQAAAERNAESQIVPLNPAELKGVWAAFTYNFDNSGLVSVRPGNLPSIKETRFPGQSDRGEEYAFDLRLGAQADKNGVNSLNELQDRLRSKFPDITKLYLPTAESFHIALAGRYPDKKLGPLSEDLIMKTVSYLRERIIRSGTDRFMITISGLKRTTNGTIVLELTENTMLGQLRGNVSEAMRSAGWNMEKEVRANLTFGGIITLGRIIPNLEGNWVFMGEDELRRLDREISIISEELKRAPIGIEFDTVSFVHPAREFLSVGWESEIKIPLGKTDAAQITAQGAAEAKVKVLFADYPANPRMLDDIRPQLLERFGGKLGFTTEHGNGKDATWLRAKIETEKPNVIVVRSETTAFNGKDPSIFEFAKQHGLKAIIRAGVGYDNIDVDMAAEHGISVGRTHGSANSVADLALTFLFASISENGSFPGVRRQSSQGSAFHPGIKELLKTDPAEYKQLILKSKKWAGVPEAERPALVESFVSDVLSPLERNDLASIAKALKGKTIGILGWGQIAQATASKLKSIADTYEVSFTVLVYSRSLTADNPLLKELGFIAVSREDLFKRSNIVTIHLPGIAGLELTSEELSNKRLQTIVNTSRSSLVKPELLTPLVKSGKLKYYGDLDMTPELYQLIKENPKNAVIFPHIAASTKDGSTGVEARTIPALVDMAELLLNGKISSEEQVLDIVNGVTPERIVSGANTASAQAAAAGAVSKAESGWRGELWKKAELAAFLDKEFDTKKALSAGPIFVPRAVVPNEARMGLTPVGIKFLRDIGVKNPIYVQEGLGINRDTGEIYFSNDEYLATGAEVLAWEDFAEKAQSVGPKIVVNTKDPQESEFPILKDAVLLAYLHLAAHPALARNLCDVIASGVAYETISYDDNGILRTPVLAPASHAAGWLSAVRYAETVLAKKAGLDLRSPATQEQMEKWFREDVESYPGMPRRLAGALYRKTVVVLGGGEVGASAAFAAADMGASVYITEINVNRVLELERMIAERRARSAAGSIEVVIRNQQMYPAIDKDEIRENLWRADAIIGAYYVEGAKPSVEIDHTLYQLLKKSGQLEYVADPPIDQGGSIAIRPGAEVSVERAYRDGWVMEDGVSQFTVRNMPSAVPLQISLDLERAKMPYLASLLMGSEKAIAAFPELASGFNIYNGKVTHPNVARDIGKEYVPLEKVLSDARAKAGPDMQKIRRLADFGNRGRVFMGDEQRNVGMQQPSLYRGTTSQAAAGSELSAISSQPSAKAAQAEAEKQTLQAMEWETGSVNVDELTSEYIPDEAEKVLKQGRGEEQLAKVSELADKAHQEGNQAAEITYRHDLLFNGYQVEIQIAGLKRIAEGEGVIASMAHALVLKYEESQSAVHSTPSAVQTTAQAAAMEEKGQGSRVKGQGAEPAQAAPARRSSTESASTSEGGAAEMASETIMLLEAADINISLIHELMPLINPTKPVTVAEMIQLLRDRRIVQSESGRELLFTGVSEMPLNGNMIEAIRRILESESMLKEEVPGKPAAPEMASERDMPATGGDLSWSGGMSLYDLEQLVKNGNTAELVQPGLHRQADYIRDLIAKHYPGILEVYERRLAEAQAVVAGKLAYIAEIFESSTPQQQLNLIDKTAELMRNEPQAIYLLAEIALRAASTGIRDHARKAFDEASLRVGTNGYIHWAVLKTVGGSHDFNDIRKIFIGGTDPRIQEILSELYVKDAVRQVAAIRRLGEMVSKHPAAVYLLLELTSDGASYRINAEAVKVLAKARINSPLIMEVLDAIHMQQLQFSRCESDNEKLWSAVSTAKSRLKKVKETSLRDVFRETRFKGQYDLGKDIDIAVTVIAFSRLALGSNVSPTCFGFLMDFPDLEQFREAYKAAPEARQSFTLADYGNVYEYLKREEEKWWPYEKLLKEGYSKSRAEEALYGEIDSLVYRGILEKTPAAEKPVKFRLTPKGVKLIYAIRVMRIYIDNARSAVYGSQKDWPKAAVDARNKLWDDLQQLKMLDGPALVREIVSRGTEWSGISNMLSIHKREMPENSYTYVLEENIRLAESQAKSVYGLINQNIGKSREVPQTSAQAAAEAKPAKPMPAAGSEQSWSGGMSLYDLEQLVKNGNIAELVQPGLWLQSDAIHELIVNEHDPALLVRYTERLAQVKKAAIEKNQAANMTPQEAIDYLAGLKLPSTDDIYDSFRRTFARNPSELAEFERLLAAAEKTWSAEQRQPASQEAYDWNDAEKVLSYPATALGKLNNRIKIAFIRLDIKTIEDLLKQDPKSFLILNDFKETDLEELRLAVAERGLALKDENLGLMLGQKLAELYHMKIPEGVDVSRKDNEVRRTIYNALVRGLSDNSLSELRSGNSQRDGVIFMIHSGDDARPIFYINIGKIRDGSTFHMMRIDSAGMGTEGITFSSLAIQDAKVYQVNEARLRVLLFDAETAVSGKRAQVSAVAKKVADTASSDDISVLPTLDPWEADFGVRQSGFDDYPESVEMKKAPAQAEAARAALPTLEELMTVVRANIAKGADAVVNALRPELKGSGVAITAASDSSLVFTYRAYSKPLTSDVTVTIVTPFSDGEIEKALTRILNDEAPHEAVARNSSLETLQLPAGPEEITALGRTIADESQGRYNLLLPMEFFAGKLAEHQQRFGSRFKLDGVSGLTKAAVSPDEAGREYVDKLLEKIGAGEESLTIAIVPSGLAASQVERLKSIKGIRVIAMDIGLLQSMSDPAGMKDKESFQVNTYAMMYAMRNVKGAGDETLLRKILDYFISGHLDLAEGMTLKAYIEALVNNDVERMIKACLKPAMPVNAKEEHDNLSYPLIFA